MAQFKYGAERGAPGDEYNKSPCREGSPRFEPQIAERQIWLTQARFKRRSIHAPNLTDELSTVEERRLNQFGSAD